MFPFVQKVSNFQFQPPRHVAIVIDDHEAAERSLSPYEADGRGLDALRRTVQAALDIGVEILTILLSSPSRSSFPTDKMEGSPQLLGRFVRDDLVELNNNNVRVRIVGVRDFPDPELRLLFEEAESKTRGNLTLMLVLAFNYGGRQDICSAVRRILSLVALGKTTASEITADLINQHLDTSDLPDPDLIIRTGGEQRQSDFLLWQSAYSELVFVQSRWPDFDRRTLEHAITEYHKRERRFGGLAGRTRPSYPFRAILK